MFTFISWTVFTVCARPRSLSDMQYCFFIISNIVCFCYWLLGVDDQDLESSCLPPPATTIPSYAELFLFCLPSIVLCPWFNSVFSAYIISFVNAIPSQVMSFPIITFLHNVLFPIELVIALLFAISVFYILIHPHFMLLLLIHSEALSVLSVSSPWRWLSRALTCPFGRLTF